MLSSAWLMDKILKQLRWLKQWNWIMLWVMSVCLTRSPCYSHFVHQSLKFIPIPWRTLIVFLVWVPRPGRNVASCYKRVPCNAWTPYKESRSKDRWVGWSSKIVINVLQWWFLVTRTCCSLASLRIWIVDIYRCCISKYSYNLQSDTTT